MKIKITSKEEFNKLQTLSKEEYIDFLKDKVFEVSQSSYIKRFKIGKENDLYRLLLYPPCLVEDDRIVESYEENEEQRKGRLELKKDYYELYAQSLSQKTVTLVNSVNDNGRTLLDANEVENALGITRKTLYTIADVNGEKNFKLEQYNRRLYVEKESLLEYLNKHHFCSTGLHFEKIYTKVKSLKYCKKNESSVEEVLNDLVNSKEVKDKWQEYYEEVPDERRVYKASAVTEYEGVKIYSKENIKDDFDVYNPNIMVCTEKITEIPQLRPISYWAAFLGVGLRTALRYCELGYMTHYKIGGRSMISDADFQKSLENLNNRNTTKKNAGRKKRVEHIFDDDIVYNEKIASKFNNNDTFKRYKNSVEEIKKFKDSISVIKKAIATLTDKKEVETLKIQLKESTASLNRTELAYKKFKKDFFNEELFSPELFEKSKKSIEAYYQEDKKLKVYERDLKKARENGDDRVAEQLAFLVDDIKEKLKKYREEVILLV